MDFDSLAQSEYKNKLKGKTVAIIGASASTHGSDNVKELIITNEDIGVELSAYVTYNDV